MPLGNATAAPPPPPPKHTHTHLKVVAGLALAVRRQHRVDKALRAGGGAWGRGRSASPLRLQGASGSMSPTDTALPPARRAPGRQTGSGFGRRGTPAPAPPRGPGRAGPRRRPRRAPLRAGGRGRGARRRVCMAGGRRPRRPPLATGATCPGPRVARAAAPHLRRACIARGALPQPRRARAGRHACAARGVCSVRAARSGALRPGARRSAPRAAGRHPGDHGEQLRAPGALLATRAEASGGARRGAGAAGALCGADGTDVMIVRLLTRGCRSV
jgi:hypothetical protein